VAFTKHRLRENVPLECTACPHDYTPNPTADRPRRCTLAGGNERSVDGIHCGEDTGLGSMWEANLRMPTLIRWTSRIAANSSTTALVSSLDLVPTILSLAGIDYNTTYFDGVDIGNLLFDHSIEQYDSGGRVLFFWRDGFLRNNAPLGPPYGRMDVVAVKIGRFKAWYSTKSAHYNADLEDFHDPPLLFDTIADPAEAYPIEYDMEEDNFYAGLVQNMNRLVQEHKEELEKTMYPLTLLRDSRYIPCVDPATGCRQTQTTIPTELG
jgi:arylsulfatase A-like enzyme